LLRELAGLEALYYGAHVAARQDLGLAPGAGARLGSGDPARDLAAFVRFARGAARDVDVRADVRAMVPLAYAPDRGKVRVRAMVGWARRPLVVTFARPPDARVFDAAGRDVTAETTVRWTSATATLHYPVELELEVARVLDRDAFRRLCDRKKSPRAIAEHLAR
jgi:hypothetical protein